jgi:Regulator of G protein signaling domain
LKSNPINAGPIRRPVIPVRRQMADLESGNIFRDKISPRMCKNYNERYQRESSNMSRVPSGSNSEKIEWLVENEINAAIKYANIEAVILNPLCCGYLLQFCEGQHNSENVRFFLEVDEFRDMFAADKDKDIWDNDYEVIDNRVKFLEADDKRRTSDVEKSKSILRSDAWPSASDKEAALNKIDTILTKYLINDSTSQVCISDPLIEQTLKRIKLLHLYGPEVFEEATREPIKTMRKDILPRFLVSTCFRKMIVNVASCEPTSPPASELKVPPPRSWLLTASTLDDLPESRRFDLDEVLNCLHLFNEFLSFLRNRVSSENLICVRMIDIFQDLVGIGDLDAAEIQAWKIYQFFIAPGSAYEVSVHHVHRKHVMLDMADPGRGTFDRIRNSVHETLKGNFETFKLTDQYVRMGKMMRDRKLDILKLQGGDAGQNVYAGCFGLRK